MSAPRIISRLLGGAGNQLFQYAVGRALADRLGCDLVLDNRYVAGSRDRGDCFGHFAQARFERSDDLPPAKSDGALRYGLWRGLRLAPRLYRERHKGFDPAVMQLGPGRYLHGYWQSYRYFEPIADQLRRDLAFTSLLDGANAEMAGRIAKAQTPVSIHVRRGDYVTAGAHGVCTADYYRTATAQLSQTHGALTCFVFSNDPDWVRDNLDLGQETVIVDINDEASGIFDMHLQSLCAHHVIANSSFSWWAAWLNPSADKQVIAPRQWFAAAEADNPDLIPGSWIRI